MAGACWFVHTCRVPPPHFDHDVVLSGRTLDEADFRGAVFEGHVDFTRSVFSTRADFTGAVFKGRVYFQGAVFEDDASFQDAVFERFANFASVRFRTHVRFKGATFDELSIKGVSVERDLLFNWARFQNTSLLGPIEARTLDLRQATFHRRVRVEAGANRLLAERSRFLGGVRLLVGPGPAAGPDEETAEARWPDEPGGPTIDLTDVEFGAASLVGPRHPAEGAPPPRIVALGGTDVGPLTVSYTRLSECRLAGVHNLNQLTIEGHRAFESSPPRAWLARRAIIRDEHLLRATWGPRAGRGHWALPGAPSETPESAAEVEQAYRALRRGRADAKDEIGGADFYYGEMEMRRFGQYLLARRRRRERWWPGWAAARGEHLLLWLYWAVSGYGLRAWRAFTALALVVALTAAAFLAWGYRPGANMDFLDSVRFSLRAATSLLRGPEQKLTATGEWIELALRFTGPVLFGLAILALRGRVRR